MGLAGRDRGVDPHRRLPGQSRRIVHNPGVEGRVLAATAGLGVHKLLEEEARASGYGSHVSEMYTKDILSKEFTYWPLGQSGPRGQYPVRYS